VKPAVFLDRDGTVAVDVDHCRRPEDFHLLPGAGDGIALLNHAGLAVVMVTNQSGLARGLFSWATLETIHSKMHAELARSGAVLKAVYVCPHHPDDGCECRKPCPGLLRRAAAELGIDLRKSYMIGDRRADVLAGRACGCTTVIVDTGPEPPTEAAIHEMAPDHHATDLHDAARWIVQRVSGLGGVGSRRKVDHFLTET
jgi:histidinol-phosphate phosphatase family protein